MRESLSPIKVKDLRQRGVPLSGLSQVILIDWSDTQANIAFVVRDIERWRVEKEFNIAWEDANSQTPDPKLRGKQLREAIAGHDVSCRQVVVSVPRRNAVIKLLELPSVKTDVLTDAVILQAESRGISADTYVIDYVAQPETTDGTSYVLMVAYSRQLIENIQSTFEFAGQMVLSIGLGEFGLAGALPRHQGTHPGLLMIAEKDTIDFVVTRYGCPISSMTLPQSVTSVNYGKVILATLSRLCLALPQSLLIEGLKSIVVTGPEANSAISAIQSKYDLSIQLLETPRTRSLRAWGLAMDQSRPDFRIDFQNPKQAIDTSALKRSQQTRWLVRGGLVLALLFLCFQFYLSKLDTRAELLNTELSSLEERATQHDAILDAADQLVAWQTNKVNWSEELVRFLDAIPDNQRVFLSRVRVEQNENQLPDIRIEGLARELDDAIEMNQRLVGQAPRYQIRPDNIERQDQNPHYRVGFVVSATVDIESQSGKELTEVGLADDGELLSLPLDEGT